MANGHSNGAQVSAVPVLGEVYIDANDVRWRVRSVEPIVPMGALVHLETVDGRRAKAFAGTMSGGVFGRRYVLLDDGKDKARAWAAWHGWNVPVGVLVNGQWQTPEVEDEDEPGDDG